MYWRQRAKSFWLTEGDSNTMFFHAAATKRKKTNMIESLVDDAGNRIEVPDEMGLMVVEYFRNIFKGSDSVGIQGEEMVAANIVLKEAQNNKLNAEIKFEEFTKTVKQMHPDKSAGPDGFSPAFFQHFWELIGPEIFKCCTSWLEELSFPANLNDTTLVLIPKRDNADKLTDLRPIALCNVLYKILSKVLANRIKEVLPNLISENQSAFVPGRNISDNVLVAFELLHYMKRKNRGGKVEWLRNLIFPRPMIAWIGGI